MTSLGGVVLSDHLILDGLENAPGIVVNQRRTITGKSVVQHAPVIGGRAISLLSESHLTLQQVQDIKTIESNGVAVTLVHPRGTFSVIVTGVSVTQDEECVDLDIDAWFSGSINMIEV